jgi:hypothetical protein
MLYAVPSEPYQRRARCDNRSPDLTARNIERFQSLSATAALSGTWRARVLEERPRQQVVQKSSRAARTPFLSFFTAPEMLALARDAGFAQTQHISTADLIQRYFTGRTDGVRPSSGEAFPGSDYLKSLLETFRR